MAFWKGQNCGRNRPVTARGWEERKELTIGKQKRPFQGMELFYVLAVVVGTQLYVFVKTHRTVHSE